MAPIGFIPFLLRRFLFCCVLVPLCVPVASAICVCLFGCSSFSSFGVFAVPSLLVVLWACSSARSCCVCCLFLPFLAFCRVVLVQPLALQGFLWSLFSYFPLCARLVFLRFILSRTDLGPVRDKINLKFQEPPLQLFQIRRPLQGSPGTWYG